MDKQHIDKLALIEIKDRKLLVTLSRGKDTWYTPGGKREENETDHQALIREVYEELTLDLVPATIKLYSVFEAQAHGKPEGTMVRMTCYVASYTSTLQPSAEIEKISWFTHSQKHFCSAVDNLIFDALKRKI